MIDELRILQGWPSGLEDCPAASLLERLGGPTVVRLPGRREPPVFVSVLLHGNETSGWEALCQLMRRHRGGPLPRTVILLIGNVRAAAVNVRTLADQCDFNRVWSSMGGQPGAPWAATVQSVVAQQPLFAAVDLHNNTGHNPHYSVVIDLSYGNLALAWLFDDQAVYVREPSSVLTRQFAGRCPAVALELGPVGDPRCDDRAFDFLARLLHLDTLPEPDLSTLRLYRTEARVHVADDVAFSFAGAGAGDGLDTALVLTGGMEAVNFHALPAGTEFGATALTAGEALRVLDTAHADVTDRYFINEGGRLLLREPVIPAMYTVDPAVVRQDCLCYLMCRLPLERFRV